MRGLVLFDIDGTLLRVGDREHHAAFVHAMRQVYGLPATLDGVPMAGMLDAQIARLALSRHGLPEAEIDAQLADMIAMMGEHYAASVTRRSRVERVLTGVPAVVAGLRDAHFALGVLTGNAEAVARVKLEAAELDGFFPIGAYGDTARERGHLVETGMAAAARHFGVVFRPSQTVLVGDTPRDVEAARAGGAKVLAVATGRYSVDELADVAPDAVLPDLGDPPRVVMLIEELVDPRAAR